MKIAMIGQKGLPAIYGGVERHVDELSQELVRLGHEVVVYCRPWYSDRRIKNYQGIILKYLPSIHTKHFDAISHTFFASIHALWQNYDIIHYHGVGPALLCWIPRIFKPRARVVVTFHSIDREHDKWGRIAKVFLTWGEWFAVRLSHRTITVSSSLRDYCEKVYQADTAYIPNGVNLAANVAPGGELINKLFGLTKDSYILVVSRLVRHKGIHHLISAYNQIKTDKKLVIAGDSVFTYDYVLELKELAAGNPNIIFTGYQKGRVLAELFANAELIVHPSESEGLSISVLEAMLYGKPALVSDIRENVEVVKNPMFHFKNKSVDSLVLKLNYLLSHKELLVQRGKASRSYVVKNYNWADIASQTENLYQKVLTANCKSMKIFSGVLNK